MGCSMNLPGNYCGHVKFPHSSKIRISAHFDSVKCAVIETFKLILTKLLLYITLYTLNDAVYCSSV